MKILILEANPYQDLSLDREIRELRRIIDDSSERNEFQVKDGAAVSKDQLHDLMLEFEAKDPQDDSIIVHFCGHGTGDQGLVFENENGGRDLVGTEVLADLFALFKNRIHCVVLNACYSEVQADALKEHIKYVIGMKQAIRDDAAIAFSEGFYRALGYKKSFEEAFEFGKNAIQLAFGEDPKNKDEIAKEMRKLLPIGVSEVLITKEHLTPVLHKKKSSSAEANPNVNDTFTEDNLEKHYNSLIKAITQGRIIFFLGSDINLCGRLDQASGELTPWEPDLPYPPSGRELAAYLAKTFPPKVKAIGELPEELSINSLIHERAILIRTNSEEPGSLHIGGEPLQYLSQYAYLTQSHEFYDQLEQIQLGCQPNQLHTFLATLLAILREKGSPYPLIVTTNYDSALEEAFKKAEEPFDLVFYSNSLDAQEQDMFVHRTPDGNLIKILEPNTYQGFSFEQRPVILKLYGTADQIKKGESLVITEENYIEYLVTRDLSSLLPVKLLKKFKARNSSLLFLGYPLGNWNERIILHRIWQDLTSRRTYKWWAIQSNAEPLAQELWQSYNIELFRLELLRLSLSDYITELDRRVRNISANNEG